MRELAGKRECGLFGIGIGEPKPHEPHEWTDGDGNWFACSGHRLDVKVEQ